MAQIQVPTAKDPENVLEQFGAFVEIVKILRKECPWDKKQTNDSISHLLIEEAYEALEAVQNGDDEDFCKELGDLFLHIVMHAVMAEERDAFNLVDILKHIQTKMVHRHPHVFGELTVSGEEQVLQNWEALKKQEGRKSVLEGVPLNMPALLRAQRIQHKVSKVGFDWSDKVDVWKKVDEEFQEFKEEILNKNTQRAKEEFGDFLFALVNAARFEGIVAEEALQFTNKKFINRFNYIENKARENKLNLIEMSLKDMDALWDEAKEQEKLK